MKQFKEYLEQKDGPNCWTGYKKQGTKKLNGKIVNNCVPEEVAANSVANDGVDMNPSGKAKKQDRRSKFFVDKMFKRAQGAK
jgi:hypothetical protein|tara:strand:+ start:178 stop:423 length:246 start_codon:yes stop_codon:yes gene_type:complete